MRNSHALDGCVEPTRHKRRKWYKSDKMWLHRGYKSAKVWPRKVDNVTTITVRFKLNDADPVDAAIIEALRGCTRGRMSGKIRELLAGALGITPAAQGAKVEHPAPRALPAPRPPVPDDKPDDKTALEIATANFMNAFEKQGERQKSGKEPHD